MHWLNNDRTHTVIAEAPGQDTHAQYEYTQRQQSTSDSSKTSRKLIGREFLVNYELKLF